MLSILRCGTACELGLILVELNPLASSFLPLGGSHIAQIGIVLCIPLISWEFWDAWKIWRKQQRQSDIEREKYDDILADI